MRIVVVGLGSELMGDDAAGLKVIDLLMNYPFDFVDYKKCFSTGFEIMEIIEGYDVAIIADAISTGRFKRGEIVRIEPDQIRYSRRISSFHDFDLITSIELGKRLNLKMPEEVIIYGIEIEETLEFSCEISSEVMEAIKELSKIIIEDIKSLNLRPRYSNGGF